MVVTAMQVKRLFAPIAVAALLAAGLVPMAIAPASAATLRETIVSAAQTELAAEGSAATRKHAASGTCNFYTGVFRTWKSSSGCGASGGVQWRNSDWCADFAKYVWRAAGVAHAADPEGSGGILTGWASSFKDYGTTYGTWHTRASGYTPQPGDSLNFDWDLDGTIDHVGIVTSANSSTVYTIEGNSGSPGATRAKSYSRGYTSIVGYTAPLGGGSPPPTDPPPTTTKYWVDTFAAAPGYSTPGGTRTGTLYAATNYVFCKVWGPVVQVGSQYNHWWMRTDLDEGSPWQNQYVSAYYLTRWGNDEAKDNNGVTLPDC
jgi:hypothetical protein